MSKRLLLGVVIVIALIVGGSFAFARFKYGSHPISDTPTTTPENYICQQDAKICPDGSTVGRVGPNCTFSECPGGDIASSTTATTTATSTPPKKPSTKPAGAKLSLTGTLLGGSLAASPLLEFNQSDYRAALNAGKLVVLFFSTNWDQFSRTEFEALQGTFNGLGAGAVGFRVNYNDNSTSADERLLARDLNVTNMRTKLLLQGETVLLRSKDAWSENDFRTEINARI